MTWSRASRLFPYEDSTPPSTSPSSTISEDRNVWIQKHTGFLPVADMTRAVHETGYDGWWSLEVFNTSLMEEDEGCPTRHGERGILGLKRLWEAAQQSSKGIETRVEETDRLVTPPLIGGEDTESEGSELESMEDAKDNPNVRIVEREVGSTEAAGEVGPISTKRLSGSFEEQTSTWDGFFKKVWRRLSFGTNSSEGQANLPDSRHALG